MEIILAKTNMGIRESKFTGFHYLHWHIYIQIVTRWPKYTSNILPYTYNVLLTFAFFLEKPSQALRSQSITFNVGVW